MSVLTVIGDCRKIYKIHGRPLKNIRYLVLNDRPLILISSLQYSSFNKIVLINSVLPEDMIDLASSEKATEKLRQQLEETGDFSINISMLS